MRDSVSARWVGILVLLALAWAAFGRRVEPRGASPERADAAIEASAEGGTRSTGTTRGRRPASLAIAAPATDVPASSGMEAAIPPAESVAALQRELARLQSCYGGDCAFPETDPRSYDFAVGQELASVLRRLRARIRDGAETDPGIARIARETLANADGHVQEAALDLLGEFPPDRETLATILREVFDGGDANLVEPALAQLKRYEDPGDRERIHEALAAAMLTGSPLVGATVSERMAELLSRGNVAYFERIAGELPEGTTYRRNLTAALTGFARR